MMITILTIDSTNYGNRLQNYALTRVLETISGGQVRTVRVRDFGIIRNKFWYPLSRGRAFLGGLINKRRRRDSVFLTFTHRFIPTVQMAPHEIISLNGLIVIGSDQCWNPEWGLGSREDGLQCAIGHPAAKNLSYAASFGITLEAFSPEWRARYAELLQNINCISVREDEAARIVSSLTGSEAQWVLDPTMLLNVNEWKTIERAPKSSDEYSEGFVLKYILGNELASSQISDYATKYNLPIIEIGRDTTNIGPSEFIWLIHHAHAIFTDSFHGSVFSLLFHKRVFVFTRNDHLSDMSSRFLSLGKFTGFNQRMDSANALLLPDMNWTVFEEELERFRFVSMDWLSQAMLLCE